MFSVIKAALHRREILQLSVGEQNPNLSCVSSSVTLGKLLDLSIINKIRILLLTLSHGAVASLR